MFLDEFDHIIKISIHALREEGDQILLDAHAANNVFLSTPSARRATNREFSFYSFSVFLSTPSARRATKRALFNVPRNPISIHALREEGDAAEQLGRTAFCMISIHALREEGDFEVSMEIFKFQGISIHALREEGDIHPCKQGVQQNNFYPRPPRGGRLRCHVPAHRGHRISIHALREEGDFFFL